MDLRDKNILFLIADQIRSDVFGFAGHPLVKTPHLDALARRSCRYTQAFTPSPLCGPARISLFTGTYPHTHGCTNHPNPRHRSGKFYAPQLSDRTGSLLACIRDHGYRTHGCGYLGFHAYDRGERLDFDKDRIGFETLNLTSEDYRKRVGDAISRDYNLGRIHSEMWEPSYFNVEGEACPIPDAQMWDSLCAEDIRSFLHEQDGDRPFFAYCGFRAPHPPWRAPAEFHGLHSPDEVELPDFRTPPAGKPRRVVERFSYFEIQRYPEQWIRNSIAAYYDFVAYVDDCVGRIMNELEAQGLREDTLVVFCGDHGENLYDYGLCEKHTLYDSSLRIPLLFSLPGEIPENESRDHLAELTDVFPTLLAGLGIDLPDSVEGVDLGPSLHGTPVRKEVKAEFYATLDPCRMVRDLKYKYIHTEDDINELYDIENDPKEKENLAWNPDFKEIVREKEAAVLADWEIPAIPPEAPWNDLNERKQKQFLDGLVQLPPRSL